MAVLSCCHVECVPTGLSSMYNIYSSVSYYSVERVLERLLQYYCYECCLYIQWQEEELGQAKLVYDCIYVPLAFTDM